MKVNSHKRVTIDTDLGLTDLQKLVHEVDKHSRSRDLLQCRHLGAESDVMLISVKSLRGTQLESLSLVLLSMSPLATGMS